MKLLSLLLVIILVFCPTVWARSQENTNRCFKIGVLSDLSGPAAYWGIQTRLGAEIAASELNSKEEHCIRLYFGDTQLKTAKAVTEAQKLISIDRVDAVYSEFTATSTAVSSVVMQHKKLFVYSAAAFSIVKSNPYSFKSYLDYFEGCREIAKLWKKAGVKRLGILKATAEFGEICSSGARSVYPNLQEVTYHYGEDVSTQVLLLKKKGVEGVLNVTYESDMLRMMKSMATIKYFPYIGVNEDAMTKKMLHHYPEFISNATLFGFSKISNEFLQKIKSRDPKNNMVAIQAAALAYLHVKQIYQVLASCERNDLDCQLEKLNASPSDNIISFNGWKNRIASFDVALKKWNDGQIKAIR